MARTNNLTNFLTDVAAAIKTKLGTETPIPASQFDTKIGEIETGGTYQAKSVIIQSNGSQTITPDSGYDALSSVAITVQVPIPQLQNKSYEFTQNTHIVLSPETGYDGFSSIELTINVPQEGGSGDVKLFETEQAMQADPNPQEGDLAVIYREETQPATESSEFNKCIFPNTVTLDEAFDDYNSGEYNAVDPVSGDFNASCELSSSSFTFNGSGDAIGTINIEYESSDGITYTRADGGAELQEFGTTITRDVWSDQWVDAIGEFIQLRGNNYFEGLYKAVNSGNTITYQLASTQLDATSSYVYGKTFYGQNGIENGTLVTNVSNSFADVNAEIVYKIQQQYENMTPRVLTDSDKTIDRNIYFIPTKKSGIPLLDTSNITNAKNLFLRCTLLTTIPGLNVGNATTLEGMFEYCSALISIAALDTDSATSTVAMFKDCSSLTTVPNFDTGHVTIMSQMFLGCKKLTGIPWFDASNVKYMYKMFDGCTSLVTIPVLDTSSVIDMASMFSGCSSLSNAGLINILKMCINATNVTSNKTLKYIGLTSEQATTCGTLYNYQAFLDAGWTTGY